VLGGGGKVRPQHRRRWLLAAGVGGAMAAALTLGLGSSAGSAPIRAPRIRVPSGFASVARYQTLVRNYVFTGSSLPSDWTAGNGSFGFQWMLFDSSEVRLTGDSVALRADEPSRSGAPYRGGIIETAGRFTLTHGVIDFRARMPAGQGLWSGLWAVNPSSSDPQAEIDVQEMLLGNTHVVYGSLHDWNSGSQLWQRVNRTFIRTSASSGFHDYEVVWQPGMVTWAVDGVAYAQYTRADAARAGQNWPFDSAQGVYLLADLAVSAPGGWGNPPNSQTTFPASMEIQSVRIWE
jgi:beta-glucanase (GH16 family)